MINNIIFPSGVKWSLNYIDPISFFSDDFVFPSVEKLFRNYTGVVVKNIDISQATSTYQMFSYASSIISIPQLDTSNVTNMTGMFEHCDQLLTVPQMDTSKVTTMVSMFSYCGKLITIPQMDTSKVTTFSQMFYECSNLISIPQLDTSNVTSISQMFSGCYRLESIPMMDCSKVTSAGTILNSSWASDQIYLTDMGGFKNIKVNFDIQKAPNLTIQSLMNVINNLYDFRANGETTTRTLQLGTTNLNKLTDEQKAVATNKGWNLT